MDWTWDPQDLDSAEEQVFLEARATKSLHTTMSRFVVHVIHNGRGCWSVETFSFA